MKFSRILGILILLSCISFSSANITFNNKEIYYSMNTPPLTITSDAAITDCTFYINNIQKTTGFDVNLSHTLLLGFNDSINNLKLTCTDTSVMPNEPITKQVTVFNHTFPVTLWLMFLSPLLLVSEIAMILIALPLIFFQVIPITFMNDIAFLIYCLSVFCYGWMSIVQNIRKKGEENNE